MGKYSFILLAGGIGLRLKKELPKQFLLIGGKPIIMHSLEKIESIEEIVEVIIVCHPKFKKTLEEYLKSFNIKKKCIICDGGNSRQESVYSGLTNANCENVIIHEAARPFVKTSDYRSLIYSPYDNAIFAIEIPFTVAKGDKKYRENLNRSELLNIQLPQKFRRNLLFSAHQRAKQEELEFTEDASLLFHYHQSPIHIIQGFEYNIKITTPLDFIIAEVLYKEFFLGGRTE